MLIKGGFKVFPTKAEEVMDGASGDRHDRYNFGLQFPSKKAY
jgi:hypothetical protein